MTVKENLQSIQASIQEACQRVGRNAKDVQIIAVTKYVSVETANEAILAGVKHLGENRVEGGLEKWEALHDKANWHFIGSLQSRKVKDMIGKFEYIHSLERLSLAKEIDKRAKSGQTVKCFVQVNISEEQSKSGLSVEEVIPFIHELAKYESIQVIGLMTMAPFVEDAEETRPIFRRLKQLQEEIRALNLKHAPCTELSMGMSNDYIVAIEEGATYIRLGTSLVGKEF
ncbi:MAG TPA: YggS family pyridoxal phosphate-dependent enzyme [Bacilli bacterium]|nr:YggS family pyridoxal phosphate-dependent enzyme [Bacilli bacterium]